MSANPLFDGNLVVTIGGVNVTADVIDIGPITTTNPGGFGSASMTLKATAAGAWGAYHASVVRGAVVTVVHSGTTLFEGEVINDVSHAIVQSGDAFYRIECAGLWDKAGRAESFSVLMTDSDYSEWWVSDRANKSFDADTNGRLYLGITKGSSTVANSRASIFYWIDGGIGPSSSSVDIKYFIAELNYDVGASNWYADISTSPTNPWGTWTVQQSWNNTTATAGMMILALPAGTKCIRVSMYSNADRSPDTTPISADRWFEWSKVCVAGASCLYVSGATMTSTNPTTVTTGATNHSLEAGDRVALKRSGGSTGPHGWYTVASVPSPTTFTIAEMGSSSYTLDVFRGPRTRSIMSVVAVDASFSANLGSSFDTDYSGTLDYNAVARPHTARSAFIDDIASRIPDKTDYGFWDSGVFYCKAVGLPPSNNDYVIDGNLPGIDFDVFKNDEAAADYVKVLYAYTRLSDYGPDGWAGTGWDQIPESTTLSVWYPSEPTYNDASVRASVWDQWQDTAMSYGMASNIALQIKGWLDSNAYVGTIRIATPTVPKVLGGTKNTAYIRAGDYIQNSRFSSGRLRITSTSLDPQSGVVTLGIGENRREFVARINTAVQPRKRRVFTKLGKPSSGSGGGFFVSY